MQEREIVNVVLDYVMLNDRGAGRAADLLGKMGGDKVFAPDNVIVVFDHHYPPIRPQDSVGGAGPVTPCQPSLRADRGYFASEMSAG